MSGQGGTARKTGVYTVVHEDLSTGPTAALAQKLSLERYTVDQESIVYGCIKDAAYGHQEHEHREANRHALLTLPSASDWPLISREMFSVPRLKPGAGHYQTQVLHFGASYQAIEYEWEQWIAAFESLLRNMYWVSATVHLETELSGTHTFTWNALSDSHQPGSHEMQIHCEWSQETALGF